MTLTVKKLLENKVFKHFEVITPHIGMDRIIDNASILDYEFADIPEPCLEQFDPDGLVITSLLFAKDNPKLIVDAVAWLCKANISAFAYKDVIYKDLPNEAIELAKAHDICIMKFSNTYFDNILFEVIKQIYKQTHLQITAEELFNIVCEKENRSVLEDFIRPLTFDMAAKIVSIEYNNKLQHILERDHREKIKLIGILQNQMIFINFYDDQYLIDLVEKYNCRISFSSYRELSWINKMIQEAYCTMIYNNINQGTVEYFANISIYKMLTRLALTDHASTLIEQELHDLLLPKNSALLETAICYVLHGAEIEKCAYFMDCHVNTVRYRLKKIEQLLRDNEVFNLYSQLFNGVHLYLINQEIHKL